MAGFKVITEVKWWYQTNSLIQLNYVAVELGLMQIDPDKHRSVREKLLAKLER